MRACARAPVRFSVCVSARANLRGRLKIDWLCLKVRQYEQYFQAEHCYYRLGVDAKKSCVRALRGDARAVKQRLAVTIYHSQNQHNHTTRIIINIIVEFTHHAMQA